MYAFWQYGEYPYVLGGKTDPERPGKTGTTTEGMVYVPSYLGWVRPIWCTEDDMIGERVLEELHRLEREHKVAQEALRQGFLARARAVVPFDIKG
jgi:hypothetical protein